MPAPESNAHQRTAYRLRRVESPRAGDAEASAGKHKPSNTQRASLRHLPASGSTRASDSANCEKTGAPSVCTGARSPKGRKEDADTAATPPVSVSASSVSSSAASHASATAAAQGDVLLGHPALPKSPSPPVSGTHIPTHTHTHHSHAHHAHSHLPQAPSPLGGTRAVDGDGVSAERWTQQLKHTFPEHACVVPGRLYWGVDVYSRYQGASLQDAFYFFSTDLDFVYDAFYADFGPLNLGQTWRYCEKLQALLGSRKFRHKAIVHYCSSDPCKKANAAYLIAAYSVICLGKSASEAMLPFELFRRNFLPFRDATYGICTYPLRIIDCLKGLEQAMKLGWFSFETFDIDQYEHYEKILNGDLNWIIPNKFIAFSGPVSNPLGTDGETNCLGLTPQSYVPIFKKLGVTLVIRLNKKQYCRKYFLKAGINHVDLYFLDGSCPSKEIIYKFLSLCESEEGAVAVHCKAGLGRTGTLVGCYAMKHYGFNANEWIGWNRICRPGSVLGPQQIFLHEIQREMQPKPTPSLIVTAKVPIPRPGTQEAQGIMTPQDRHVAERGDFGQGDRLVSAKRQAKFNEVEDGSAGGTSPLASATPAQGSLEPLSRKASPLKERSEFLFKKRADESPWHHDLSNETASTFYLTGRSRSAQKYTPPKMQRHPNISPAVDL